MCHSVNEVKPNARMNSAWGLVGLLVVELIENLDRVCIVAFPSLSPRSLWWEVHTHNQKVHRPRRHTNPSCATRVVYRAR